MVAPSKFTAPSTHMASPPAVVRQIIHIRSFLTDARTVKFLEEDIGVAPRHVRKTRDPALAYITIMHSIKQVSCG